MNDYERLKTRRCLGRCRTASWAPEYGGMAVVEHDKGRVAAISGNNSEKLKIAARIELDQCLSAPQMGSTKKRPQTSDEGLVTIQGNLFPLVTKGLVTRLSIYTKRLQFLPELAQ